jgi:hypothetical protein
MDRYAAWTRRVQEFSKNPDAYIEKRAAPLIQKLEKRIDELDQQIAQRQQESALEGWCQRNTKLLYLDGDPDKGLTEQGKKISRLAQHVQPGENMISALDEIAQVVLDGAPKPTKRTVPTRAKRTPTVASKPPTAASDDEHLEAELAKKGLAQVLAEQAAAAAQ